MYQCQYITITYLFYYAITSNLIVFIFNLFKLFDNIFYSKGNIGIFYYMFFFRAAVFIYRFRFVTKYKLKNTLVQIHIHFYQLQSDTHNTSCKYNSMVFCILSVFTLKYFCFNTRVLLQDKKQNHLNWSNVNANKVLAVLYVFTHLITFDLLFPKWIHTVI